MHYIIKAQLNGCSKHFY